MVSRKKTQPAKSPSAPIIMETLESRTLLDATVPVATWTQGSTHVFAMDMADTGLTQAELLADVTVKFNKDNSVASITLKGKDSLAGLGLYVTGASKVGTIADHRNGAVIGDLSFIASAAPVTSLTLKSGLSGSDLNGWGDLGGLGAALPADIDGDGVTTDLMSLYIADGNSGKVDVKGQLGGDVFVGGNLSSLTNRSDANAATPRVTPIDIDVLGHSSVALKAPQITMNFNVLDQVDITSNIPIKSFTARAVTAISDGTGVRQLLTAPTIGSIKVTGGKSSAGTALPGVFQEDVTLFGPPAKGVSLGSITTKASVQSTLVAPGRVNTLNVSGSFSGGLTADSIGTITCASIHDAVFTLQPNDPTQLSVGKVTVRGSLDQVAFTSTGNLGDFTVGGLWDTTIFAGVTNPLDVKGLNGEPDGIYDLPVVGQLTAGVSIKSVKVVGYDSKDPSQVYSIMNSNIAADRLGKISLGNINYANSFIPFGLAFNTYTSITAIDYDLVNNKPTKAGTYTYGGTNWVPLPEDFLPA